MDQDYINQRRSMRRDCTVPVDSRQGSTFNGTQTVDISRDGIGFVSDHAIAVNERIAVEVVLTPNSAPVLVMGIVKWSRKISDSDQYRVGMSFQEVISGSRRNLNQYIRRDEVFSDEV